MSAIFLAVCGNFMINVSNEDRAKSLILSARLSAVAAYVRTGSAVADIGCDHSLLCVKLALDKTSRRIAACDIADGPIEKARRCVEKYGLEHIITVIKTDGLNGLETFSPDDIIIAGMGGELIRDIIEASDYAKKHGVNLILQPMTKSASLRNYLAEEGFEIDRETLVKDGAGGRIYEVMRCFYNGESYALSDAEALIGAYNIKNSSPLLCEYAKKRAGVLLKKINGMKRAGLDTTREAALYDKLKSLELTNGLSNGDCT